MQTVREVAVYDLLPHAHVLRKLESFQSNIIKCNFTTYTPWGWNGKLRINIHEQDIAKPHIDITGVAMLDAMGYKASDIVVLTEEQHRDWQLLSGGIN